jgi:hypothetical protein
MDVNDVKIVRRLEAGMADRVNVHACLAKAVQKHRFGSRQLFGANCFGATEDSAYKTDFHAYPNFSQEMFVKPLCLADRRSGSACARALNPM